MAKKTPRPGRTLLIFGLAIVVLYGLAALGQTWKPRLGLDLEGGTRITLSAVAEGRSRPTKLKQAAAIIDARVNGSGVSEAEVSTRATATSSWRSRARTPPTSSTPSSAPPSSASASWPAHRSRGRPAASPSPSPSPSGAASQTPPPSPKASPRRRPTRRRQNPRPAPFAAPQATPSPAPVTPSTPAGLAGADHHRQGRPGHQPGRLGAEPGRGVAEEVRRLHVPREGQGGRPRGRQPGPAADHL